MTDVLDGPVHVGGVQGGLGQGQEPRAGPGRDRGRLAEGLEQDARIPQHALADPVLPL